MYIYIYYFYIIYIFGGEKTQTRFFNNFSFSLFRMLLSCYSLTAWMYHKGPARFLLCIFMQSWSLLYFFSHGLFALFLP